MEVDWCNDRAVPVVCALDAAAQDRGDGFSGFREEVWCAARNHAMSTWCVEHNSGRRHLPAANGGSAAHSAGTWWTVSMSATSASHRLGNAVSEAPADEEPVTDVQFPMKLVPLMEQEDRKRFYITYGGRASGRSWAMARALLLLGLRDPLLILCAREVMKSIGDSIHRLLVKQIELLGLKHWYEVQETTILGRNGCEFIFAGLRTVDATKLKSYESVDICMVEEAETVSKRSWNILIPTIRAPQSEIWVNFNPYLDTDETYQRFVEDPPEKAWGQKVTWRDNPWWSEVLEGDRKKMERSDPEEYDNIYEGNARLVVAGAIYAKEIRKMVEEQRFRNVPYDPRLLVHTIHDIGWNDQHTVIFAQRLHSEVRV